MSSFGTTPVVRRQDEEVSLRLACEEIINRSILESRYLVKRNWSVREIKGIVCHERQDAFRQKLSEFSASGIAVDLCYMFTCVRSEIELESVEWQGLSVETQHESLLGNCIAIGNPAKGVSLVSHADVLLRFAKASGLKEVCFIICEVAVGRNEPVDPYTARFEPTPHADSHSSSKLPKRSRNVVQQFVRSQVYLYEEDATSSNGFSSRPRHCLPVAVIKFDSCGKNQRKPKKIAEYGPTNLSPTQSGSSSSAQNSSTPSPENSRLQAAAGYHDAAAYLQRNLPLHQTTHCQVSPVTLQSNPFQDSTGWGNTSLPHLQSNPLHYSVTGSQSYTSMPLPPPSCHFQSSPNTNLPLHQSPSFANSFTGGQMYASLPGPQGCLYQSSPNTNLPLLQRNQFHDSASRGPMNLNLPLPASSSLQNSPAASGQRYMRLPLSHNSPTLPNPAYHHTNRPQNQFDGRGSARQNISKPTKNSCFVGSNLTSMPASGLINCSRQRAVDDSTSAASQFHQRHPGETRFQPQQSSNPVPCEASRPAATVHPLGNLSTGTDNTGVPGSSSNQPQWRYSDVVSTCLDQFCFLLRNIDAKLKNAVTYNGYSHPYHPHHQAFMIACTGVAELQAYVAGDNLKSDFYRYVEMIGAASRHSLEVDFNPVMMVLNTLAPLINEFNGVWSMGSAEMLIDVVNRQMHRLASLLKMLHDQINSSSLKILTQIANNPRSEPRSGDFMQLQSAAMNSLHSQSGNSGMHVESAPVSCGMPMEDSCSTVVTGDGSKVVAQSEEAAASDTFPELRPVKSEVTPITIEPHDESKMMSWYFDKKPPLPKDLVDLTSDTEEDDECEIVESKFRIRVRAFSNPAVPSVIQDKATLFDKHSGWSFAGMNIKSEVLTDPRPVSAMSTGEMLNSEIVTESSLVSRDSNELRDTVDVTVTEMASHDVFDSVFFDPLLQQQNHDRLNVAAAESLSDEVDGPCSTVALHVVGEASEIGRCVQLKQTQSFESVPLDIANNDDLLREVMREVIAGARDEPCAGASSSLTAVESSYDHSTKSVKVEDDVVDDSDIGFTITPFWNSSEFDFLKEDRGDVDLSVSRFAEMVVKKESAIVHRAYPSAAESIKAGNSVARELRTATVERSETRWETVEELTSPELRDALVAQNDEPTLTMAAGVCWSTSDVTLQVHVCSVTVTSHPASSQIVPLYSCASSSSEVSMTSSCLASVSSVHPSDCSTRSDVTSVPDSRPSQDSPFPNCSSQSVQLPSSALSLTSVTSVSDEVRVIEDEDSTTKFLRSPEDKTHVGGPGSLSPAESDVEESPVWENSSQRDSITPDQALMMASLEPKEELQLRLEMSPRSERSSCSSPASDLVGCSKLDVKSLAGKTSSIAALQFEDDLGVDLVTMEETLKQSSFESDPSRGLTLKQMDELFNSDRFKSFSKLQCKVFDLTLRLARLNESITKHREFCNCLAPSLSNIKKADVRPECKHVASCHVLLGHYSSCLVKCQYGYKTKNMLVSVPNELRLKSERGKPISVEGVPLFFMKRQVPADTWFRLLTLAQMIEDFEGSSSSSLLSGVTELKLGWLHDVRQATLRDVCCKSKMHVVALKKTLHQTLSTYRCMSDDTRVSFEPPALKFTQMYLTTTQSQLDTLERLKVNEDGIWMVNDETTRQTVSSPGADRNVTSSGEGGIIQSSAETSLPRTSTSSAEPSLPRTSTSSAEPSLPRTSTSSAEPSLPRTSTSANLLSRKRTHSELEPLASSPPVDKDVVALKCTREASQTSKHLSENRAPALTVVTQLIAKGIAPAPGQRGDGEFAPGRGEAVTTFVNDEANKDIFAVRQGILLQLGKILKLKRLQAEEYESAGTAILSRKESKKNQFELQRIDTGKGSLKRVSDETEAPFLVKKMHLENEKTEEKKRSRLTLQKAASEKIAMKATKCVENIGLPATRKDSHQPLVIKNSSQASRHKARKVASETQLIDKSLKSDSSSSNKFCSTSSRQGTSSCSSAFVPTSSKTGTVALHPGERRTGHQGHDEVVVSTFLISNAENDKAAAARLLDSKRRVSSSMSAPTSSKDCGGGSTRASLSRDAKSRPWRGTKNSPMKMKKSSNRR